MGNSSSTTPCATPADRWDCVSWSVDVGDGPVGWEWSAGPVPVRQLRPIRGPRSTAKSRHIPVRAHCVTTGEELRLESGLEHDLLRELDRTPSIEWIVAQPLRLTLCRNRGKNRGGRARQHVPDLLTLSNDGVVTVWDVRPVERQDERFLQSVEWTRDACSERGWRHAVFGGHSPVVRSNLMWLHAFRHDEPWMIAAAGELNRRFSSDSFALSDLEKDASAPQLVATVWHLLWNGRLQTDLERPLSVTSLLSWVV